MVLESETPYQAGHAESAMVDCCSTGLPATHGHWYGRWMTHHEARNDFSLRLMHEGVSDYEWDIKYPGKEISHQSEVFGVCRMC